MKAKEIRDLIDFISGSGLEEVNIETEEFKISVKRSSPPAAIAAPVQAAVSQVPQVTTPQAQSAVEAPAASAHKADPEAQYVTIKSPMIGTFYKSANPESPAFASIGDEISKGDPVCIIEAMKLFNEIESDISGKIVKVLVDDASPVEYDQPLFLVDPS